MAQNIVYSPWGGTKGPWLCLMARLLLFGLVWLFSFAPAFSHPPIKLTLWLKVFYKQKAGGGHGVGEDHGVLLCFTVTNGVSLLSGSQQTELCLVIFITHTHPECTATMPVPIIGFRLFSLFPYVSCPLLLVRDLASIIWWGKGKGGKK